MPALRTSFLACVFTIAAACTGSGAVAPSGSSAPSSTATGTSPVPIEVADLGSLTAALRGMGFEVRQGERVGGDFFTVPGKELRVDGNTLTAYEFPSEDELDRARGSVSKDGFSIATPGDGSALIEWTATPHFYGGGRLLVIYVGERRGILDSLDLLMGPQFAGG